MNRKLLLFVILVTTIVSLSPMIQKAQAQESGFIFSSHPNLFVSAENAQFDNYFGGPQVIEVRIVDADISATNVATGEPDVTINGKTLRMVQAVDGNWYAYFADKTMAMIADSTTLHEGKGLDFGKFCLNTTPSNVIGISLSDTVAFSLPNSASDGSNGQNTIPACNNVGNAALIVNHVIKSAPQLSAPGGMVGQIGINSAAWPVVQLYTLSQGGDVVIQYNKGGGTQTTTLTFDKMDQFASLSTSSSPYLPGQNVVITLTDHQLNVDPTGIDVWTFGAANANAIEYRLFDYNTVDGAQYNQNIKPNLGNMMFESNGLLTISDNDKILSFVGNEYQIATISGDDIFVGDFDKDDFPVTFFETYKNSGVFSNAPPSGNSNVKTVSHYPLSPIGKKATITYGNIIKDVNFDGTNVPTGTDTCEISWDNSIYVQDGTAIITTTDDDRSTDFDISDIFEIKVWSETDNTGIVLNAIETSPSSRIFTTDVTFTTSNSDQINNKLKVSSGDTITAQCSDSTLPSPYKYPDALQIITTAQIQSSQIPVIPTTYQQAYDGLFNTPQQKVKLPKIEDYANIPKPTPIPDPKIENSIYKLQSASNPQDFATKSGLQYKNGMVRILISGQINDSIISQISGLGIIETKSQTSIQAVASPAKIKEISKISGVEKIRPAFLAFQNAITSEGVTFTKADQVQNQGLSGKNIKIAVLDLAFDTSNSEISDNVVDSKSLRHDSGAALVPVKGYGNENVHGTAVAEIIVDMAPDADLFLYTFGSEMEFTDAVDAAMQKKVNLIAMSAGWMNYAADGKSDMTKKVEQVISKGIPFIVSSGNYAETHWEDKFADSDGNGWHEFKSSDEGLSFEVTQSRVSQKIPIVTYLMWSDSSSTVTDFNLSLTGPSGNIVYEASTVQSKKGDEFEYIYFTPNTAGTYSIGISHSGSSKPNATLEIFSQSDLLEYYTSAGSASVPNDANGIISVGALNYNNSKLESFSSQGPTNNGKFVPSIMGPDAVNTKAYGEPFYGTSAAAPHVAGIVALILEATPGLTPAQIASLLQENADKSSLGISKNDNVYGYGKAIASFLNPAATSDIVIPEWVRTNALWWYDKKIDDQTFASGLQFLIKQKIIVVPVTESGEKKDNIVIPEWVRTNAKWWYDGKIDDQTFASGLQFLIKSGIITV